MPSQNESRKINNFLAGARIVKGDEACGPMTHTIVPGTVDGSTGKVKIYPGKYSIDTPEKEAKFFQLYYNHIKHGYQMSITEVHKECSPMKFDLDFRFPVPDNGEAPKRKYTLGDLKKFLGIFWNVFDSFFETAELGESRYHAYIQEKPCPRIDKNLVKDGVHIMFPNIVTDPRIMYVIRNNIIKNNDIVQLFKDMGCTNPVDDIIDKAVIEKNNWLMYGSSKPGGEPYKLTYILDKEFNEVNNNFSIEELINIQSIRRWREKDEFLPNSEKLKPLFDNIYKEYESLPQKHSRKNENNSAMKPMKKHEDYVKKTSTPETIDLVQELVKCLSPQRADGYQTWLTVGWALHNIDYNLLKEWITFSKLSSKFEEGVCEREWEYMRSEGLGLGSINMWARQDNPILYAKIINKNLRGMMELVKKECTPADMAKIIYMKYKYLFVCVNAGKKDWYHFVNHRWRLMREGIELRKIFSAQTVELFEEFRKMKISEFRVVAEQAGFTDDSTKDGEEKINKDINKVITQLKKTSFKKNLLEECGELFYDSEFESKLDSHPYLIGFENGVYDLENEEFRDGYPEDYMTFSTGNNYMEFNTDSPEVQNVELFLSQVLPKRSVRNYMMGWLATCLCGKLFNERFHILTGSGGNGKSKLMDLFKFAFRDYCYTLPIAILTKTRQSGENASPVMAQTRGKRFLTLQEPENDSRLNTGFMKELTGGDTITARPLFKEPFEFKPQFKMGLICNDMPDPNASDDGTWRRIRVVDFIARFCDNPNADPKKYEFPIDEKLDEKLHMMKETFMYLLIERFKKFKNIDNYKLTEPDEVRAATKKYKEDMDQFSEFMDITFIQNDGNSEGMKKSDIWPIYKEWFSKNKSGKMPGWQPLVKAMEKKYGKYKDTTGFKGLCKKNESFTSEEDEMDI
jgi:P4 family phage/plasmid primase-like protien